MPLNSLYIKAVLRAALIIYIALAASAGCSSGGQGSQSEGDSDRNTEPLINRFPIDGMVDLSGFEDVSQAQFSIFDETGAPAGDVTLRYAFVNDNRNLYFAFS